MHDPDATIRRLAGLDLNLLIALHALLRSRSVTDAAQQLGRTQSTVSHALQRLRHELDDPLLVRSGRQLVLTERARGLQPAVAEAVAATARVFEPPGAFVPSQSQRRFVLGCPDLAAAVVPGLLARLGRLAPRLEIAIIPDGPGWAEALASGASDLAIGVPLDGLGADLVTRALGSVRFAVVARRDHPALAAGSLDLAAWTRWPHVVVRSGEERPNLLQQLLASRGIARVVGLEVPGFLLALHVVAHTDMFFAAPEALVRDLAGPFGLALRPLPIEARALPVALFWHRRAQADPGHLWLREQVWAEIAPRLHAAPLPPDSP